MKSAEAKTGRPSVFSEELANLICEGLADGKSLRELCGSEEMPNRSTVFRWLADPERAAFRDQYARARECSGDADADDVAHYARKAAEGVIEPAAATAAINGLKWSAAHRKPKVYGDKLQHVGGGPDDSPIRHAVDLSGLNDEELEQLERIRSKLGGVADAGGDQSGEGASEAGG